MEQNLSQEMLDKLTKVCICKSVNRTKIKAAIKKGANTFEKVREVTGAGTGTCGATRCKPKIEELIKAYNETKK